MDLEWGLGTCTFCKARRWVWRACCFRAQAYQDPWPCSNTSLDYLLQHCLSHFSTKWKSRVWSCLLPKVASESLKWILSKAKQISIIIHNTPEQTPPPKKIFVQWTCRDRSYFSQGFFPNPTLPSTMDSHGMGTLVWEDKPPINVPSTQCQQRNVSGHRSRNTMS